MYAINIYFSEFLIVFFIILITCFSLINYKYKHPNPLIAKYSQYLGSFCLLICICVSIYQYSKFQNFFFYELNVPSEYCENILIFRICFLLFGIFFLLICPYKEYSDYWEYSIIILISILGFLVIITSSNLFNIFLVFELVAVSVYILIFLSSYTRKLVDSGIEYFILSAVVNLFFLFGISFFFYSYPSFLFEEIQYLLISDVYVNPFLFYIFIFIFVSFAFKFGLVPFYNWLPVIYEGFPISLLMFLMVPVKIVYFIVLIKLLNGPFLCIAYFIRPMLYIFGLGSIVIGILGALRSNNYKVLFGYASMLHSGIILVFIGNYGLELLQYVILYLLLYGFLLLCLFLFCLMFSDQFSNTSVFDFDSMLEHNGVVSWWFFLSLFTFVGIPPLFGFLLKAPLVLMFIHNGSILFVVCMLIFISASGFYYLKVVKFQKFNDFIIKIRLINVMHVSSSWFLITFGFIQIGLLFFPSFLLLILNNISL